MAELTIFLMGELTRKLLPPIATKEGKWTEQSEMTYIKFRGEELYNKVLGLVG